MTLRAAALPFSRVYRRGIGIGIADTLAYRGSFLIRFLFQLFPLVTALFLWRAVYRGGGVPAIAGFDAPAMLSYFVLMSMLRLATFVEDLQWTLPRQIRQGDLNKYLVRPVDFVLMEWHMRMGQVAMQLALLLVPAGLVCFLARHILVVPAEGWRWVAFLVAVALGIQIGFLISVCVGFCAFWLLETSALLHAIFPVQMLLAGGWFPLELLPRPVFEVVNLLPWASMSYLAMRIYLGMLGPAEAVRGILGQLAWIAVLAAAAWLLWRRGLRRYAAVGG